MGTMCLLMNYLLLGQRVAVALNFSKLYPTTLRIPLNPCMDFASFHNNLVFFLIKYVWVGANY